MADTVADMTKEELRDMLESLIEEKLMEMLGDPDEGLEIEKSVRERLISQRKRVAAGERGQPMEDLARDLDLS
jgi:DNA primase large subunit